MQGKKRRPLPLKKEKNDKAPSVGFLQSAQSALNDRYPVLKFLLGFLGFMAVFYVIYYSDFYQSRFEPTVLFAQANAGNGLLHMLGHNTKVMGAAIASNDFSVDIQNGCDGIEAIAVLVSGILIFPATRRQKAIGLIWGVGTLAVLNLLRIAGLYWVGLHFSKTIFEMMHVQGGFIVFTMISVLLLFTWMNWVMKTTPTTIEKHA